MGYRRFTQAEFSSLDKQHNIMAVVGNGFDIQVMKDFEQSWDTRYETFYYYLRFRNFNRENLILAEMERLLQAGDDVSKWSDLESAIDRIVHQGSAGHDEIYLAVREIQVEFSKFLTQVASPALVDELGKAASANRWGVAPLESFIQDVPYGEGRPEFRFPSRTGHYDLFNFLFVNFNYTPLLDGFLYLDQDQFDPHPYKWVDRNFGFYPNPADGANGFGDSKTRWSSYIHTEVVHPHGTQSIPRSLLFGVDSEGAKGRSGGALMKLSKPYVAQSNTKFRHLFEDTELFIVFGCSLGGTDGWWWRGIAGALASVEQAELIVYWWTPRGANVTESSVRERFYEGAQVDSADRAAIEDRIHVVIYGQGDSRIWLNTEGRGS